MKLNSNIIKVIGFAATIFGLAATVVTDWVNEKKMEEMVDEKVQAALATNATEENEEEEEKKDEP